MSDTRYPIGYGTTTVTLGELVARYGPSAPIPPHPAYWRRVVAWLESRDGLLGIGGAYRFTQPDKPGFAPPGKSFHERQRFASGIEGYAAIDLVARNGSAVHRAPTWAEVPRQGSGHPDIADYGLHCNVSGEPWHLQPVELDGYGGWIDRGRPDPAGDYPIAGGGDGGGGGGGDVTPGSRTLRRTSPQMSGTDVNYLQRVLKSQGLTITVDGFYGSETEDRVRSLQGWNGLDRDGICGPKTWAVVFKYPTP